MSGAIERCIERCSEGGVDGERWSRDKAAASAELAAKDAEIERLTRSVADAKQMEAAAVGDAKKRDEIVLNLESEIERLREDKIMLDTWGLGFVEKLGEFVRQVAAGGPLATCIRYRVGEEGDGVPLLWLWATTSEQRPEARLAEVVAERDRLKASLGTLLQEHHGANLPPSDMRTMPGDELSVEEAVALGMTFEELNAHLKALENMRLVPVEWLREIEWAKDIKILPEGIWAQCCPGCHGIMEQGHAPDCWLGNAIKEDRV